MRFSFVFSLLAAAATHSLAQTPEEEAFFPGPSTISTPSPPPPTFTHSRRAAAVLAARGGGYGGVRTEADAVNLNLETWAEDTTRACAAMINGTTQANNPSGISLCYNIPLLITATGVFAADLRLFNVSPPTGDWADVPLQNYSVNLVYAGAVITPPRNLSLPEITASDRGMNGFNLSKLVDYEYIGKLDNDVVAQSPPDDLLKSILTPQIYLQGITAGGKLLNITVSSDKATFITGVFGNSTGANQTELAAESKETPFKLPGTRISITPIGLYFFSAYLVLAGSIFGWGTLERAKFRDQYRRRVAEQARMGK